MPEGGRTFLRLVDWLDLLGMVRFPDPAINECQESFSATRLTDKPMVSGGEVRAEFL